MDKQNKIKKLLSNMNVLPKESLLINNLKQEDIDQFCSDNGLTWEVGGHGSWLWVQFLKDGEMVQSFKEILEVE